MSWKRGLCPLCNTAFRRAGGFVSGAFYPTSEGHIGASSQARLREPCDGFEEPEDHAEVLNLKGESYRLKDRDLGGSAVPVPKSKKAASQDAL